MLATILALWLLTFRVRAFEDAFGPNSLHKVSLTSHKALNARASAFRKRRTAPINDPLDDYYNGTDLQWYGNISVGSPPQVLSVIFDTGSFTLEFYGIQCGAPCGNQTRFDPDKSSTYVDLNTTSEIVFTTGIGVNPIQSETEFVLNLLEGRDTVTVGGIPTLNSTLYIIYNQTDAFTVDPFSGTQGMSPQVQGFMAGLVDQGYPALFGMYLTPKAVSNAELTIGGIDKTRFRGDLKYSALPPNNAYYQDWQLVSPQIFVNGESSPILMMNRTIIFDSGTPNVYFDPNTTNAIYEMISPEIQPYAPEPGAYGIACSKIDLLPAEISVTFTTVTGEPFNLTIPSSEFNLGPFEGNSTICQTMINALPGLDLLGGSLLKHYYSVWDIGNQTMGFAPNIY